MSKPIPKELKEEIITKIKAEGICKTYRSTESWLGRMIAYGYGCSSWFS
jgi:hypothetical protein